MKVRTFDQKVDDFLDHLERPTRIKVSHHMELLKQFGNQLRMPYSKSLGDDLFELRIRGQQEVRIFYTFYNQRAILLHGFLKKTQKTPGHEIKTAIDKLKSLTIK